MPTRLVFFSRQYSAASADRYTYSSEKTPLQHRPLWELSVLKSSAYPALMSTSSSSLGWMDSLFWVSITWAERINRCTGYCSMFFAPWMRWLAAPTCSGVWNDGQCGNIEEAVVLHFRPQFTRIRFVSGIGNRLDSQQDADVINFDFYASGSPRSSPKPDFLQEIEFLKG